MLSLHVFAQISLPSSCKQTWVTVIFRLRDSKFSRISPWEQVDLGHSIWFSLLSHLGDLQESNRFDETGTHSRSLTLRLSGGKLRFMGKGKFRCNLHRFTQRLGLDTLGCDFELVSEWSGLLLNYNRKCNIKVNIINIFSHLTTLVHCIWSYFTEILPTDRRSGLVFNVTFTDFPTYFALDKFGR